MSVDGYSKALVAVFRDILLLFNKTYNCEGAYFKPNCTVSKKGNF